MLGSQCWSCFLTRDGRRRVDLRELHRLGFIVDVLVASNLDLAFGDIAVARVLSFDFDKVSALEHDDILTGEGGGIAASGTNARAFNVDGTANDSAGDAVLTIGEGVSVSSATDSCVSVFGKATLSTAGDLSSPGSFAIAGILLIVISALLTFIAFMIFPDFFTRLAEYMRQPINPARPASVLPPA